MLSLYIDCTEQQNLKKTAKQKEIGKYDKLNGYKSEMLQQFKKYRRTTLNSFFYYRLHVLEADQCQLNLNVKCRLQVHVKIAEDPEWRKEENGTTELESDLFIASFEEEIG